MLPSFIVFLDELPVTPNGKVDRRALPAPEAPLVLFETQDIEARTPFEEVVQTIFQELLRREPIGREENFFAQGGHSLLATQVIARIRTMLQIELPLRSLFEAPTIAGLAQRVQLALHGEQAAERPALQPVAREGGLPLSFAQQRLWFLAQLEPENTAYTIAEAVRLRGSLNKRALTQSLTAMCQRHESLRTRFQLQGDQPVQVIVALDDFALPCLDLSGLPDDEGEQYLRQLARQEAQRPFDLSGESLLRVKLVVLSDQEQVLLVTMHHIISDGWSMRIFVREVTTLYEAFLTGQDAPLSALPIQYGDFAQWQRSWLQGEALEEQMHYWLGQLGGLEPLNLPTDHPHPVVQTYRGAHQSLLLSTEVCDALQALSQREGVTLFMTLLAAFQVLLARYSGQSDIAVGTPIANRTHAEIEGLIGFFVNTLVLRSDLSDNPSFQQLLARVREVCLGAYAHQDVPFEKLVEVLQPQRDLSRSPLFQVMLNLQQEARTSSPKAFEGLAFESLSLESPTTKFDLMLSLTTSARGMQCVVEYNVDLFEASTIARLLSHWQILLMAIVANPQQQVTTLPLLSQDELRHMLRDWNATRRDFSAQPQPLLHQLIEAQVERTPDAIAVVFEDEQISFAQLDHYAHLLALCLRSLGVGPDVLVGVCLHRSLDLVTSLLAILKAGGAYVPLDPTYPQERLTLMLANSQVGILITHSTLHEQFAAYDLKVLQLDTLWRSLNLVLHSSALPYMGLCPEHLAYMIYTSGSTGQPKGVMNIHRAICNRLLWLQAVHPLTGGDRVLQKTPVSFDVSVWELFWPLLSGACLVVARPEGHRDNQYLAGLIEEEAITTMHFVPSMLQVFLQEPVEEYCRSLRLIVSSGEALPVELARHCLQQIPQVQLYNLYGPTEAAVEVTAWPFHEHREEEQVPIGYPIANIKIHLLDAYQQPVPIGVVGELYIGGVGLARGYWQYPALTAEKFVPDPYSEQGSARLYRTGDQARYREDGAIEYLGRLDEQVKIRGFRIELGDIETALLLHPEVLECVVLAREETAGSKRLVAYVVGKTVESIPASHALRAFLQERLPEYMLPAFFIVLDALPLTLNGKLDRRALPAPEARRALQKGTFLAPRTNVEQVLAVVWAQVLRTSQPIGVQDNFFDLGGDSILGLQIIARARQQGLHLTIKQLFQHQTIAALGAVVGLAEALDAEQGLVRGAFPLTPIQHWFFSHDLVQPHHWNQARLLEVPSALDASLVARAVEILLSHHDALRLRFQVTEAGWQQTSSEPGTLLPFVEVDLALLPLQKHVEAIGAALDQAQKSLNFVAGPLLRVVFVQRGSAQANLLFLAIHHLAIDGVSWRLLLEDLVSVIEQMRQGQSVHLPSKSSSFKSWAEQMQVYAQASALQQEQAYWLAQERQEVHPLPQDSVRALAHNTEASAHHVSILLSESETQALLNVVVPATHAQMNELLLTALVQSLADWAGATYVLVDLEGHGRESLFADLDVSRTVGWFTSLFPLLVSLEGVRSVRERLEAVKAQYRALPNHGIGYGILRYLSRDETLRQRLAALPQAQVLFNYHGHFDQSLAPTSLLRPTRFPTGATQDPQGRRSHLLSVTGSIRGGQLQLLWEYSEAFHQRSTIEGLMQRLVEALRELIAQVQRQERADSVEVDLSQERLEQILTEMDLG